MRYAAGSLQVAKKVVWLAILLEDVTRFCELRQCDGLRDDSSY